MATRDHHNQRLEALLQDVIDAAVDNGARAPGDVSRLNIKADALRAHVSTLRQPMPEPDYRTLEEKLGPEFEERLSAVVLEAYNHAYIDGPVKYVHGVAEEEAEKLRMCVAEMMGFRV